MLSNNNSAVVKSRSSLCLLPSTELDTVDDYTFEPLSKSKHMEDSGPDSDNEVEPVDLTVGVTDKWLTMNEVKRRKKQKRKLQGESPKLADFKKQDQKKTPTGKK